MISEENNEEQRPPDSQSLDEPVIDESVVEEPVVEEPVVEEPTGPGQLLSRKREALGMTVQQVADELHITMHYVRALESNAHDKLPGDVFIRGYIRSYANLLKLDPVVLINVYSDFTNQQASAAEEASGGRSRRRRDKNLPWIIVSGIAFVGIAIALWYFNTRAPASSTGSVQGAMSPATAPAQVVVPAPALSDGTTPTIDNVAATLATDIATADSTPSAVTTVVESAVVESVEEPLTPTIGTLVQEPSAADTALVQEVAVPAQTSEPELPSESDFVPPDVESATPTVPAAEQEATADTVTEIVPQPAQQNSVEQRVISVDAGGEDLVQITFNGESMVQVEDGNDQQIYRDIRTSGDVLRITGSAPFNILLGDAAATELSLNGNNIDFTSNIRIDNSVRLTIGL